MKTFVKLTLPEVMSTGEISSKDQEFLENSNELSQRLWLLICFDAVTFIKSKSVIHWTHVSDIWRNR